MATFTIQFDTDNAAFEENRDAEIVAVLREIATRIEDYGLPINYSRPVRDSDGNSIGSFTLRE